MIARDTYVAIADPTRRRILDLLHKKGVLAAGDIAGCFMTVSRPGISKHLRVLRDCGVVEASERSEDASGGGPHSRLAFVPHPKCFRVAPAFRPPHKGVVETSAILELSLVPPPPRTLRLSWSRAYGAVDALNSTKRHPQELKSATKDARSSTPVWCSTSARRKYN